MAEAIGAIASAITLAVLAKDTARLIKAFKNFTDPDDPLLDEAKAASNHIEMCSSAIDIAFKKLQELWKRISRMENVKSTVLHRLKEYKAIDLFKRESIAIKRKMRKITLMLKSLEKDNRMMKRFKWFASKKAQVELVYPKLDRLGCFLNLLVNVLNLDLNTLRAEQFSHNDEIVQLLKDDRPALGRLLQMTEELYENMLKNQSEAARIEDNGSHDFMRDGIPLLRLSRSMRKIDVPRNIAPVAADTMRNSNSEESTSRETRTSMREDESRGDDDPRPHRASPAEQTIPTYVPPSPTRQAKQRTSREPKLQPIQTQTQEAETAMAVDTPTTPTVSLERTPRLRAVYGSLKTDHPVSNAVSVWATIDPSETDNYISMELVRELALPIERLGPGDPSFYKYQDGDDYQLLLGKVRAVRWQTDIGTISLDFWVRKSFQTHGCQVILGEVPANYISASETSRANGSAH